MLDHPISLFLCFLFQISVLYLGQRNVDDNIIAEPTPKVRPEQGKEETHLSYSGDGIEHRVSEGDVKHCHERVRWILKSEVVAKHSG